MPGWRQGPDCRVGSLAGLGPQGGYKEIWVVVYSQGALFQGGAGRGSHPPRPPTWIFFQPGCRVAGKRFHWPGRPKDGRQLAANQPNAGRYTGQCTGPIFASPRAAFGQSRRFWPTSRSTWGLFPRCPPRVPKNRNGQKVVREWFWAFPNDMPKKWSKSAQKVVKKGSRQNLGP